MRDAVMYQIVNSICSIILWLAVVHTKFIFFSVTILPRIIQDIEIFCSFLYEIDKLCAFVSLNILIDVIKNYLLAMSYGIFDVYKNNGQQLTLCTMHLMQFISL